MFNRGATQDGQSRGGLGGLFSRRSQRDPASAAQPPAQPPAQNSSGHRGESHQTDEDKASNAGGSVLGELPPSIPKTVDERPTLGESLGEELDATTQENLKKVGDANKKKTTLQADIKKGDSKIVQMRQFLEAHLQVEGKAAELVEAHRKELEGLMRKLELDAGTAESRAGEQMTAARRLEEEYNAAVGSTTAARLKAEDARRRRAEAAAAGKADIEACDEAVINQEALSASAKERLESIRGATEALKQRLAGHRSKEAERVRERDFHAQELQSFTLDHEAAKSALEKARELKRDNDAALESHNEDASQRLRAHEAEVRRAKDKVTRSNKLRDLRTRAVITSKEDKQALTVCGDAASDAATRASEEFSKAEMDLDNTRSQDDAKRTELHKAAEKATTSVEQRSRALQTLDERMKIRRDAAYEARRVHAQTVAAVSTAQEELDALQGRADGPLTEAHKAAEAKAEQVRTAAQDSRSRAAVEEAPLRHSEEAEQVVLRKTEEQESKLVQSLSAARVAVAEAEADASLALGTEGKAGSPISSVVAVEGAARLKTHQADEQEAKQAAEAAERAVERAREELQGLKQEATAVEQEVERNVSAGSMSPAFGRPEASAKHAVAGRVAAAEVALQDRERVLNDASAKLEQARAAVAASKAEVGASASSGVARGASTPALLRGELDVAKTRRESHEHKEKELKTDADDEEAKWQQAKADLEAKLHIARLEFERTTEDMKSHENFKDQYKKA